jgi:aconitase A
MNLPHYSALSQYFQVTFRTLHYLDFRQREKGQEESQHLRHYNKLDFDKNQADRSRFLPRLTTE